MMHNKPYNKILVVTPAWIGDIVMANSLFRYLEHIHPAMELHVLAPAWSKPLLQRMSSVRQIIVNPLKHGELKLKQRYSLGKVLREHRYQQAIVLPRTFKSALIPYWANIPYRTGWLGEFRYGVLNDIRDLDKKQLPMMVQRYLGLGLKKDTPVPDFKLWYPQLQVDAVHTASLMAKFGLDRVRRIAALCPGAAYGPAKRWPDSYFGELAKQLLDTGWQVWLMGSANDAAAASTIQQLCENRCTNFIGATDLADVVDLLAMADIVVANDSGLTHVAAAVDKPVIAIYGSSSSQYTPPLSNKAEIVSLQLPCSPCFKRECPFGHYRCLYDIKPHLIFQKITGLFP